MNSYLQHFIGYFEQVFHPAGGSDTSVSKKKSGAKKSGNLRLSPEAYNIRGGIVKKQEKLRRNPAP